MHSANSDTAETSTVPRAIPPASEFLERLSLPLRAEAAPESSRWPAARDLFIVLCVSLALRLPYFHGRLFPLNDGGMFAEIIDNLRAAHFHLPTHTGYNFLNIPLSYPPLGFYLGALCTLLPGQSAVSVLAWLPLAINIAGVLVAYFIALEIYPARFYACLAACCYAAMGRSAEWLTMGGGLTRAPGATCAAVAILLILRAHKRHSFALAAWSGVWAGIAALFHLEGGMFAALSLIVLSLLLDERLANLGRLVLAGAVSVVVVLPWLIWIKLHLGFEPLRYAARTGGTYQFHGMTMPILLLAAIAFAIFARFPYFIWMAVIPFVMRRSPTHYGPLVGGLCMVWFANAILVLFVRNRQFLLRWQRPAIALVALALSLSLGGLPSVSRDRLTDLSENSRAQLSEAEIEGMRAAANLTPPDARFFVFNQRFGAWQVDMVAEWFPYFARRQCLNTVQGREWLPGRNFAKAEKFEGELEVSGSSKVASARIEELHPDYLFLAAPFDENQQWLASAIAGDAASEPIYRNSEVTIYKVHRTQ
jgi:hypothetical protein